MSKSSAKEVYSIADVSERWSCPKADVLLLLKSGEICPATKILRKAFLFWPDVENPEEWAGKCGDDFLIEGYVYFDFSRAIQDDDSGIVIREVYPSPLTRCVDASLDPWESQEAVGTDIGLYEPLQINEGCDLVVTAEQLIRFESDHAILLHENSKPNTSSRRVENNRSRMIGVLAYLYVEACIREPNTEQLKDDQKRLVKNGQISVNQLCNDIKEAAKRLKPDCSDGLQKATTHPRIIEALRNIDLIE